MITARKMINSYAAQRQAKGFTVPQLLDLLDETVSMLYKHECAQTLYVDAATGLPPLLATTSGTYGYSGPSGTWRVSNILLRANATADWDYNTQDYGVDYRPGVNTQEYIQVNGNYFYIYDFVSTVDAVGSGRPTITFSRDPGDQTTRYYMQAYKNPPNRITHIDSVIPIPDSNGLHMTVVFPCFMKLVEAANQGNYDKAIEYIEARRPVLWNQMNKGAQGKRHQSYARPY